MCQNGAAVRRASMLLLTAACACSSEAETNIEPVYDAATGRLELLKYDSRGQGRVDTWSYMNGSRILRIEMDRDGDGTIDRWEYYDATGALEKVGYSRANDGRVDAWVHQAPDGSIGRRDTSTGNGGMRTERYEQGVLAEVEEDSDGDGRIDRWETYDGGRLASLALDTQQAGRPDRRILYGADGNVRVEVVEDGPPDR